MQARRHDQPPLKLRRSAEAVVSSSCLRVFVAKDSTTGQFPLLRESKGYTFVELLVVAAIIVILASAVMPLAKVTSQRNREAELRRSLREMRTAIDRFKDAADLGMIGSLDLKAGSENYPADLQQLVDGVTVANDATGRKLKFLRRVPIDPMMHSVEWGLRSYQDKPDSTRWGGQNVFDVYTTFGGTALDGTKYKDW
jgi:general secretion pathway protein G